MCGICGVVRVAPPVPVDGAVVARMRDAMRHRGPDDEGLFVSGNVGLGHRRLSIIDLSGGHQPMANDDASVWIVYNGETYNFRDLRKELEARGYAFRTKSDTEVILRSYEAYGEACVDHLRGMFAFAIWDARQRRLFLARDRMGIKPLYYAVHGGAFLFASEIKAILQWPGIPREVDPRSLRQYLRYRYVPGPRTMFRGIFKLQPGHVLIHRDGRTTVREYWDLPVDAQAVSAADAAGRLRELLDECVQMHLVSDVPLGTFLSGGLDSTVVTGLMARAVSDPIQTFSVGYAQGDGMDERPFARVAAERFRTVHRELTLGPQNFWEFLPRLVWFLDEPVADPAAVPLYFLSGFAREFVTVAMSGEGADEILAGYAIYARMRWLERLRHVPGLSLIRPAVFGRKLGRYLDRARLPLEESYRGVSAVFGKGEGERLLLQDLAPDDDDEDFARSCFERTKGLDPLKRMLYFDLKVWLPDDLLLKADKMTMATSVELRVPFLDHRLVEWTWQLPSDLKLAGSTGKYLLRKATRDLVPAEILRRPKQGFVIPVREWFRKGLGAAARELLIGRAGPGSLFNAKEVETLIARHESGREDLSEALFTLAVLASWHRVFIDSSPVQAPPELRFAHA